MFFSRVFFHFFLAHVFQSLVHSVLLEYLLSSAIGAMDNFRLELSSKHTHMHTHFSSLPTSVLIFSSFSLSLTRQLWNRRLSSTSSPFYKLETFKNGLSGPFPKLKIAFGLLPFSPSWNGSCVFFLDPRSSYTYVRI